jgi:hypothetical protein
MPEGIHINGVLRWICRKESTLMVAYPPQNTINVDSFWHIYLKTPLMWIPSGISTSKHH